MAYERVDELTAREEQAVINEDKARKEASSLSLKYEGGLTREAAEAQQKQIDTLSKLLEDARESHPSSRKWLKFHHCKPKQSAISAARTQMKSRSFKIMCPVSKAGATMTFSLDGYSAS